MGIILPRGAGAALGRWTPPQTPPPAPRPYRGAILRAASHITHAQRRRPPCWVWPHARGRGGWWPRPCRTCALVQARRRIRSAAVTAAGRAAAPSWRWSGGSRRGPTGRAPSPPRVAALEPSSPGGSDTGSRGRAEPPRFPRRAAGAARQRLAVPLALSLWGEKGVEEDYRGLGTTKCNYRNELWKCRRLQEYRSL